MRLPNRLLALTPGELKDSRGFPAFLNGLECALKAGLPGVLLREPNLGAWDLLRLAEEVKHRCADQSLSASGCLPWFGVHDSVHIALRVAADGVHLGFQSLPTWEVRDLVGDAMAIGFSSHAGDAAAAWKGANYLFHGPVHPTPSKRGVLDSMGCEALGRFCKGTDLAVFGLGGIGPLEVPAVLSEGAGVAVLRGILGAPDPAAATRDYLAALETSPAGGRP